MPLRIGWAEHGHLLYRSGDRDITVRNARTGTPGSRRRRLDWDRVARAVAVGVGFWGLGAVPASLPQISQNPEAAATGRPPVTPAVLCLIGGQTMFSLGLVHTRSGSIISCGARRYRSRRISLGIVRAWRDIGDISVGASGGQNGFSTRTGPGVYDTCRRDSTARVRTGNVVARLLVAGGRRATGIFSYHIRTHPPDRRARHMAQVWRWMALTSGSSRRSADTSMLRYSMSRATTR